MSVASRDTDKHAAPITGASDNVYSEGYAAWLTCLQYRPVLNANTCRLKSYTIHQELKFPAS